MFPTMSYPTPFHKPHPKTKFTPAEDEILMGVVDELGPDDWQMISRRLPGRNARQCRDRWLNYLSPEVVNGPWTPAEEDLLLAKFREFGTSWKHIATFFPSRTDINIKSRWQLMQRRVKKQATQTSVPIPAMAPPPAPQPLPMVSSQPLPFSFQGSQPRAPPATETAPEKKSPEWDTVWGSLMMNEENAFENAFDTWF
jgi:hypothetical protein